MVGCGRIFLTYRFSSCFLFLCFLLVLVLCFFACAVSVSFSCAWIFGRMLCCVWLGLLLWVRCLFAPLAGWACCGAWWGALGQQRGEAPGRTGWQFLAPGGQHLGSSAVQRQSARVCAFRRLGLYVCAFWRLGLRMWQPFCGRSVAILWPACGRLVANLLAHSSGPSLWHILWPVGAQICHQRRPGILFQD